MKSTLNDILSVNAPNPCHACHNPHRAKADWSCSIATGYNNKLTWEIWGDEVGEKMADYVGGYTYQPPNKVGGGTERSANTQPDYVTLCMECHTTDRNSYQHTTVRYVNWNLSGHGKGLGDGSGDFGDLKAPYSEASRGNYVLCCTDCHEPHGSRNEWLLRTAVNGTSGIEISSSELWYYWCQACHDHSKHAVIWDGARCGDSVGCHMINHRHESSF